MATRERDDFHPIPLDLSKYPELRRSLQTREATYIEDALEDPLMADVMPAIAPLGVKTILVQPLISQDDLVGALFLRLSRRRDAFGPEEQEFAKAVAAALANSVRNAKLHASVQRKRDDLELAYVERYRELTEANRRLRELARFKDELIAIISHDLRAPLQVTLGHGRMLEEARLPGDLKTSAEAVVRQSRKILKMVESLLERGKGEQARVALDVQLLDVAKVARDCAFELEILAAERGITLRAHAPERLPVMGDELKLREVLQNLITNALEHAAENGNVLVEGEVLAPARRAGGEAGGAGRRQGDARGPAPSGLRSLPPRPGRNRAGALHLQGVRRAPRRRDLGRAPGERRLRLRLHPAAGQGGPQGRPPARRRWRDGEQPRVLIVEDEPDIAAVLEGILRKRYRVEVARDGREGRGQDPRPPSGPGGDGRLPPPPGRPGRGHLPQGLQRHRRHPGHPRLGAGGGGRPGARPQPRRGGLPGQALPRLGAAAARRARAASPGADRPSAESRDAQRRSSPATPRPACSTAAAWWPG